MISDEYTPTVELQTRSLCSNGSGAQQRSVIQRVRTLKQTGQIEAFSVEVWGKKIPCNTATEVGKSILEQIEAFEKWGDRNGLSISPFFEMQKSGSLLSKETEEVIIPPVLSMAEYHDGRVTFVTPCIDDNRVWTVADRLAAIERKPTVKEQRETVDG